MIISYEEFCERLKNTIQSGEDFYSELLENVIKNPNRYCGLFRVSNAKSKLIQNVTQSKEIKFGDFVEDLTAEYLKRLGYHNYNKNLGKDENGDELNVDQYFCDEENIYMVEMKIRDDHDSTKKRGQYSNFHKKMMLIKSLNPAKHLIASMWFVDDGLIKNRNYYKNEMSKENIRNCDINLFYGAEFFNSLKNGAIAWNEFIKILKEYRTDNKDANVEVADFGSSKEILKALIKLPNNLWQKLVSDKEEYKLLRAELFEGGDNIEIAIKERENGIQK